MELSYFMRLVSDPAEASSVLEQYSKAPRLAVDTETDGLLYWRHRIIGVSMYGGPDLPAVYLPFRHDSGRNLPEEFLKRALEIWKRVPVIGHNLRFDADMASNELPFSLDELTWDDSQVAAYTLDENRPHNLEDLTTRYVGGDAAVEETELLQRIADFETARTGRKVKPAKGLKGSMWRLPAESVYRYACRDVVSTWDLWHECMARLQATEHLTRVYRSFLQSTADLAAMRRVGLYLDRDARARERAHASMSADALEVQIRASFGDDALNVGSPSQLMSAFERQEIDLGDTRAQTLERLSATSPLAKMILSWRAWSKAVSTYYDPMAELADGDTLRPDVSLTGAVVRTSCSRPNFQAIPREGREEYRVKHVIGAPPGMSLIEADLSQAEIVAAYHYSECPGLYHLLSTGENMHTYTARNIGVARQVAKPINFAAQYGIGPTKFVDQFGPVIPGGVTLAQAKAWLAGYARTYPGVKKFYTQAEKAARTRKKVTLWTGRERRYRFESEAHTASNNLIQGCVTEMVRQAIMRVRERVPEFQAALVVHDSIVGYAPTELVPMVAAAIVREMTDFPWLKWPIKADVKAGPTWAAAKKVEV